MKAINLLEAKNHIAVIAYYETNNFGDQLITFVSESLDGTKTETYATLHEGSHLFDKKSLIDLYMNN